MDTRQTIEGRIAYLESLPYAKQGSDEAMEKVIEYNTLKWVLKVMDDEEKVQ